MMSKLVSLRSYAKYLEFDLTFDIVFRVNIELGVQEKFPCCIPGREMIDCSLRAGVFIKMTGYNLLIICLSVII